MRYFVVHNASVPLEIDGTKIYPTVVDRVAGSSLGVIAVSDDYLASKIKVARGGIEEVSMQKYDELIKKKKELMQRGSLYYEPQSQPLDPLRPMPAPPAETEQKGPAAAVAEQIVPVEKAVQIGNVKTNEVG